MDLRNTIEKSFNSLSAQSSHSIQTGRFPRKIWQQWACSPPSFAEQEVERAKSWTESNPEWRWEVLTHATALDYVESHFGSHALNRPDIVEFFRDINSRIIKADLLRYLVMYIEGGVYADIDVEALKPIHEFIPDGFEEAEIDMVIGIETDEPKFKDHPILGGLSRSFVQWTFLCRPRLPVMMRMVENAMANIQQLAKEQEVPISQVKMDFYQIIGNSGPGLFTKVIMQHMEKSNSQKLPITWDIFHQMDQPKLVSRVLVLPVQAFAAGQTHSRSGKTHDVPAALVKHHYEHLVSGTLLAKQDRTP
ncbi:glycosyltransferase family 32 [Fusarium mundagurra]|uniref:Glycosyltransferase family 32 n=1 Tax=Fusarium mundagurra TaxID=1567541 RepID=A0A8H6D7I8_9HYPO|nr:glycosyltransferase family 32 [Fusarium mundagurra]